MKDNNFYDLTKEMVNCRSTPTVMRVIEISKILNVHKDTVLEAIRILFPGKLKHGKTTYLNEAEVTAIKKHIERHHNLVDPDTVKNVQTDLEKKQIIDTAIQYLTEITPESSPVNDLKYLVRATEVLKYLHDRMYELKEEIYALRPKAESYDEIISSRDCISIKAAAKLFKNREIGPIRLFRLLREHKILMSNNLPYQYYIDNGYFIVVEKPFKIPNGRVKISMKTLVTQKGLNWILKRYDEEEK